MFAIGSASYKHTKFHQDQNRHLLLQLLINPCPAEEVFTATPVFPVLNQLKHRILFITIDYWHINWLPNSADPDQPASFKKLADQDLHC